MSETKGWAVVAPDGTVDLEQIAADASELEAVCEDMNDWEGPGHTVQPVRISTRMECAWPMDHHYWAWSCNGRHRFCASTLPDYCPDCGAPVRLDDSDG